MNRAINATYLAAIFLFLYFPIAILIIFSFNNSAFSLVWHGFTLNWYHHLFHNTNILTVALHSLIIGITAATLATFIGTLAAVCLYRYQFNGKKLLHSLILVLVVSPDIVMGIALLILFASLHITLGFWTLLLSHITFCIPFVAINVYARIIGLDKNIFEAARDLGASEFIIFYRIMVPLLWPAILTGWLLSFTLSLDDVIISFFVTGPSFQILPLYIFSLVRLGLKPEINALCSVMFGLTISLVICSQILMKKKYD